MFHQILNKYVKGDDISFEASPVDPLLVIFGEVGRNYGMALFTFNPKEGLKRVGRMCLTNQIVSKIVFSPTGRELVAAAMAAGHVFIFTVCIYKRFCKYVYNYSIDEDTFMQIID